MRIKHLITCTAAGVVLGMWIAKQLQDKELSPQKALNHVKNQLKDKLVIEGSWIQMVPEKFTQDMLEYTVYRGGITSKEGTVTKLYDFAVDTKTGTILKLTSH